MKSDGRISTECPRPRGLQRPKLPRSSNNQAPLKTQRLLPARMRALRSQALRGILMLVVAVSHGRPCGLSPIYGAETALGQSESGASFSISKHFTPSRPEQLNGRPFSTAPPSFVDSSITHFFPAYNF